jgi:hypothetical protein
MYVSPYACQLALWRNNLQARVHVRTSYPLAAYSFSLFNLGIFVSPSLFNYSGSAVRLSTSTRVQAPVKPTFQHYSCVDGSQKVILSNTLIADLLECFWRDVFKTDRDTYILIQLRIKSGPTYYSLSKIQSVSYRDKESLLELLLDNLQTFYERYTQAPIDDLFIRYAILPSDSRVNRTILRSNLLDSTLSGSLTKINLPATLDLSQWGKVNKITANVTQVFDENILYTIVAEGNLRYVTRVLSNNVDAKVTFTLPFLT